jgi:hypothetical protein
VRILAFCCVFSLLAACAPSVDEEITDSDSLLSADGRAAVATPNEAFQAFVMERIGPLPAGLAEAGRASLQGRKRLHDQLIDSEGFGLYYGTEGTWRPAKDAPNVKHPMAGSNCFAWALEVMGDAFRASSRGAMWREIERVVRKDVRGTTLARQLEERGWTVIYWNPDVEHPVDGGAWKNNYLIAAGGGGYYARHGGPRSIDDVIVNYQPNPKADTKAEKSAYAKLKDIPFYFGLAEGGTHTFVGANGLVSEMHWEADGNDKSAIEEVPLEDWYDDSDIASGGRRTQWAEGLLLIPPGLWKKG